jgi:hypothetical protein
VWKAEKKLKMYVCMDGYIMYLFLSFFVGVCLLETGMSCGSVYVVLFICDSYQEI